MRILNNAIARSDYTVSQSDLRKFKEWIKYLSITNNRPQNKPMLLNYFFDKFASCPQLFYFFLKYFKKYLVNISDKKNQKILAEKYLDILSHLCERFNFFEEQNVLNDLCFKFIDPEKYKEIKNILSKYEKNSEKIIKTVIQKLDTLLKIKNYDYELVGRYKNIYSIYKKNEKFEKNAIKINDIFAFRIILNSNSVPECFNVLNVLHDTFHPIPDLFKDYISIPKINGYQSLHTGLEKVIENFDLPIEIQIRTREMHNFSENGLAAHWLYARHKKSQLMTKKEQRLMHQLSCLAHTPENKNYIYCFSYTGDILKIPKNSTVTDFAYHIHSELGKNMKFALINNEKKTLHYHIKEGDQIRIM